MLDMGNSTPNDGNIASRRNDFGKLADSYKRFRQDYPDRVYADIFAFCPGRASKVLDLGCGTGIVTKRLAGYYEHVVGIDPAQEMLDAGRQDMPNNIDLIKASAEELPFDNESLNLVVSAAAFHWFDYDKAGAELMRTLIPGGKCCVFWRSGRTKSMFYLPPFAYENLLKYIPEIPRSNREPLNKAVFERIGFGDVEEIEYDFDETYTEEDMLGYLQSRSTFNLLSEEAKVGYMEDNRRDIRSEVTDGIFNRESRMIVYRCKK